jgi:endonuclease G
MKSLAVFAVLAVAFTASTPATGESATVFPGDLKACALHFEHTGLPAPATPDPAGSILYRCYGGFAVRLNSATKVPDWVVETVSPEGLSGGAERSDRFFPDRSIPENFRAELSDYAGSGYDRGHQAPAGDFSGDQRAQDQTFVLTNIAPQVGPCFNRGVWKDLESDIRDAVRASGRLVIFTGPAYRNEIRTIGDLVPKKRGSTVAVPGAFFKIVYNPDRREASGWLISNEKHCGKSPDDFVVTIDAIEAETGFNFLAALSPEEQARLESASPVWAW